MSVLADSYERFDFELPTSHEASAPPETRGVARDGVRMLVTRTSTGTLEPRSFGDLPDVLEPGDLVVINTSRTIPAAIDAVAGDGTSLIVHLSSELEVDRWVVELRQKVGDSTQRWTGPVPSHHFKLAGGATLDLTEHFGSGDRLWVASLHVGEPVLQWLTSHGRPIRYRYVPREWPLATYQNVYATEDGSAEMPSAGRPLTSDVITRLVARGVGVAPVILHTGVASLEGDEMPYPERARVPSMTAELVNLTHRLGHRVIAVGTTVVRALESGATCEGEAHAFDDWTDLVISFERGPRVVDGMVTGWHEPVSSHLMMLEAMIGRGLLEASYNAALKLGYLWHEFGDTHLILP